MRLEHDKEVKLAKTLLRLPEVLRRVAAELCLHNLCEYLYDISTTFTEFYQVGGGLLNLAFIWQHWIEGLYTSATCVR